MKNFIRIGERTFSVVRACRSESMTDERRESIKSSNIMIDVVIDDGKGYLLFCHEVKDASYRETVMEQESL